MKLKYIIGLADGELIRGELLESATVCRMFTRLWHRYPDAKWIEISGPNEFHEQRKPS